MADKNLLAQMLEHLVNDEQDKAEELFHEYVVSQSREIYETLIEAEVDDEDDEDVEESTDEDDDESVEENFEDIAIEADDEANPFGGDATDDLEGDLDAGEEGEEGDAEEGEDQLFQDLESIVDELQAKFNELKGVEGEEHGDDFGSDNGEDGQEGGENPFAKEEDFELETVREYVEKVPAGHGAEKKGQAEKADNTKSIVAGKNDMGGTSSNILGGKEDSSSKGTTGGLLNNKPKENNAGNINVPGGKAGNAFTTKEPGHGAEKKGAAEAADNKQSLFRGRK